MLKQIERDKILNPSFTRKTYNSLLDYRDEYILDPIDDVISFFRNIYKGIKNIVIYAPIIYNDRDWDHHYFFLLLEKKLERMYNELSTQQHAHINKKHLNSLKKCSLLVKRIVEDDYVDDKHITNKYGSYVFEPSNNGYSVLKRNRILTEKEEKQYKREIKWLSERERMLKKQDIDMLFNLLKKHVDAYWW